MKVKVGNTKYELIKANGDDILEQYYPDEDIFDIAGLIDKFNTSIYMSQCCTITISCERKII